MESREIKSNKQVAKDDIGLKIPAHPWGGFRIVRYPNLKHCLITANLYTKENILLLNERIYQNEIPLNYYIDLGRTAELLGRLFTQHNFTSMIETLDLDITNKFENKSLRKNSAFNVALNQLSIANLLNQQNFDLLLDVYKTKDIEDISQKLMKFDLIRPITQDTFNDLLGIQNHELEEPCKRLKKDAAL